LAGRRAMGEGGGVSEKGAVGFEQGNGKDRDSPPCTKSCHSKEGIFFLSYITVLVCLNIIILIKVCVFDIKKKNIPSMHVKNKPHVRNKNMRLFLDQR
jgi:hypothetical protein